MNGFAYPTIFNILRQFTKTHHYQNTGYNSQMQFWHLVIVHIFELDSPKVAPREKSMINAEFARPDDLLRKRGEFETWSQICLKALFDQ